VDTARVRVLQCFLLVRSLCVVILRALRMPLRALLALGRLGAAHRVQGADECDLQTLRYGLRGH